MEVCEILGSGNNVVKDSIVLTYGAASLGHWCVMFWYSIWSHFQGSNVHWTL